MKAKMRFNVLYNNLRREKQKNLKNKNAILNLRLLALN
jgi:hypothetical protein